MKVLVTSAWPYVNAVPHLGNLIGSILSADVFARYARLKYGKENVVFVSGSDEHGTPIEIEARKRNIEPKKLTDQAHAYDKKLFIDTWKISFDNYSRTESEVHKEFVRNFLVKLEKYIKVEEDEIPYCEKDKLFLPDRFIKGVCPYCGFEDARGDQCDNCGRLLTPRSLVNAKCALCGNPPVFKVTKHWFFDLSEFGDKIRDWISSSSTMPDNVKSVALSWVKEGLRPRSITRDNMWGIPAPFAGAENKTIYVWFEALLGYLSATVEYFKNLGKEEMWKEFWLYNDTKTYYFIGKDNIPFHAVILPAMLMASNEKYNLPSVIAATEYLLYEGQKFSKSRKIGVWIDEADKLMDVEYWRFILIRLRPEEKDTNFTWREALRIVNTELNDDIGNYANRVLSMVKRYYDGVVPSPKEAIFNDEDKNLITLIKESPKRMGELFELGKIKAGSEEILKLARSGNLYLNNRAPWSLVKTNKEEANNVLYISVNSLRTLAIMLYPIMPTYSSNLYQQLGLSNLESETWDSAGSLKIMPGHKIGEIRSLFKKIEMSPEELMKKLDEIRREVEKERPDLLR
ncbi:methionine--tRNA ligase [Sulfolobus acidocaldarius]|uniref:Methionine--tRNA ligase n=4 Tax=Sulfolobus acidocaldarius TaxID=2285 RepID=SYM_SULAC|nr:methionine--tRNA ligase [Sulfolobus acidocaldarius]Q4J8M3.1 RecName: Full=Methionine--tRNA ligase; AltName: Full=Methionyl-tRNA synthetase; Short=MetRS [Sulfolobus acidocaldarius DSM 639]AAY80857.1 methionyl-tRNA synthetase [Sulfolobus acidocaldarius DSM 639]AGE71457.1 methionyl-tRNA synthetase [Sulfolobus acidocaldarius N8]AGE73730.1 methionyl-tRNA synthetase [Sulfolobus acidocaldarius Ron12/I]ALU30308.1 methionine--tRNA ligase [Sulfolobus acidocaldarius]ALU31026.1 methionine--tRNA ligase